MNNIILRRDAKWISETSSLGTSRGYLVFLSKSFTLQDLGEYSECISEAVGMVGVPLNRYCYGGFLDTSELCGVNSEVTLVQF